MTDVLKKHLLYLRKHYVAHIDMLNYLVQTNPKYDFNKQELLKYSDLLLELDKILDE